MATAGSYNLIVTIYIFTNFSYIEITVAEVEEIVEPGELKADEIHLPGVYVSRIFKPA